MNGNGSEDGLGENGEPDSTLFDEFDSDVIKN
jgi:hypothetical protein